MDRNPAGHGAPSSAAYRAAARRRAAFQPELFIRNCGCPS